MVERQRYRRHGEPIRCIDTVVTISEPGQSATIVVKTKNALALDFDPNTPPDYNADATVYTSTISTPLKTGTHFFTWHGGVQIGGFYWFFPQSEYTFYITYTDYDNQISTAASSTLKVSP